MEGVRSIQQLDDTHLRWIAGIRSKHEEWEETRVTVQMARQPEGVIENVGRALGLDDRQASKDLG